MDWLNLHIPSQIRSPEFVGSSPAERGTWLCVLSYACQIECGGRLPGAAKWKDRQWQQAAGVTLREVRAASRLIAFDGDDVLVNGYPEIREQELERDRAVGRCGGKARTEAKALAARMNGARGGRPAKPNKETQQEPNETQQNPSRNPREGEGEGEGEVEARATTPPPDPIEVDPQEDPGHPSDQLTIQELAIAGAQGLKADHARWLGSVRASGLPAVLAGIAAVLKSGGTPWHREVAPVVARAQAQAADRKRHQAQAKPATPDLEAVKRRRAANAEELDQARRIDRWLADHPDAADRAEDPARVRTWIEYLRTAIERTTASLERPIGLPLHEVPRMLPELRAWLESTAPAPAVAP